MNWDDLVPALEAVSRELSLEVQRTFDYFASTAESERIGKIVLSGGCAKLAGIESFLASSWGVPVELARPLAAVDRDEQQRTTMSSGPPTDCSTVALGLGSGGLETIHYPDNPLPIDKKRVHSFSTRRASTSAGFGVLLRRLHALLGGSRGRSPLISRISTQIANPRPRRPALAAVRRGHDTSESKRYSRAA